MKRHKRKYGVMLPNGVLIDLLFLKRTKPDVFIYGVPYSDLHLTLIDEGDFISSHSTNQITEEHRRIGKLNKSIDYDQFLLDLFKPQRTDKNRNEIVFNITERFEELLLNPISMTEIERKNEVYNYINLQETYKHLKRHLLENKNEPFFRVSSIPQIIDEGIEYGLINDEKAIIILDDEVYEVELSFLKDPFAMNNPMGKLFYPLGFGQLIEKFKYRINTRARIVMS